MCMCIDVASHVGDGLLMELGGLQMTQSHVTVAGSLVSFHPQLKIVVLKDNQCQHVFNTQLHNFIQHLIEINIVSL